MFSSIEEVTETDEEVEENAIAPDVDVDEIRVNVAMAVPARNDENER